MASNGLDAEMADAATVFKRLNETELQHAEANERQHGRMGKAAKPMGSDGDCPPWFGQFGALLDSKLNPLSEQIKSMRERMEKLDGQLQGVADSQREQQIALSSTQNAVKSVTAEVQTLGGQVGLMQTRLQQIQHQMDVPITEPRSAMALGRRRLLCFFNVSVPTEEQVYQQLSGGPGAAGNRAAAGGGRQAWGSPRGREAAGSSRGAQGPNRGPYSEEFYLTRCEMAAADLVSQLRECGVRISISDVDYAAVEGVKSGKPRLIVGFSSFFVVSWMYTTAVQSQMKTKFGVSWGVNLTWAELQNRKIIKSHPKFKAAAEAAKKRGIDPQWRLDQCVLGKWGPKAEVWSAHGLLACQASIVIDG